MLASQPSGPGFASRSARRNNAVKIKERRCLKFPDGTALPRVQARASASATPAARAMGTRQSKSEEHRDESEGTPRPGIEPADSGVSKIGKKGNFGKRGRRTDDKRARPDEWTSGTLYVL